MSLTLAHKLLMLTNGDIVATSGDKAFDHRMTLVCQVFPQLPADEQRAIFEMTELDDVMRELRGAFKGLGYEAREAMAKDVIKKMKIERLRGEMRAVSRQVAPPSDDMGGWEPH